MEVSLGVKGRVSKTKVFETMYGKGLTSRFNIFDIIAFV